MLGCLKPELLADKFRMLDASTSNDYQGFCRAHRPAFFVILSHRYTFGSELWRDVTATVFCCKFVLSKLRPQI